MSDTKHDYKAALEWFNNANWDERAPHVASIRQALKSAMAEPDWFYCAIDPDKCGDSAYEAMHGYRDRLTPIELGTSYHGGVVWGVMYPSDKDDGEDAATFDTLEEAQAFCDQYKAAAEKEAMEA